MERIEETSGSLLQFWRRCTIHGVRHRQEWAGREKNSSVQYPKLKVAWRHEESNGKKLVPGEGMWATDFRAPGTLELPKAGLEGDHM